MSRFQKYLFFIFALFLPSSLALHLWPSWSLVQGIRVDYLSPTLYFTDCILFLLFLLEVKNLKKTKFAFGPCFLASLFLIVLFTAVSALPMLTLYKFLKLAEVVFLSVWVYKYRPEIGKFVFFPLLLSFVLTFCLGLAQVYLGSSLGGILYFVGERPLSLNMVNIAKSELLGRLYLRPYATLPHPNVFAAYLVSTAIILISLNRRTIFVIAITLITAIGIIVSDSQAVQLAAITIAILFLIKRQINPKKVLYLIFGSILVVSLLLPIFSDKLLQSSYFPTLPLALEDRLSLAQVGGEVISKYPVLGVGMGNFTRMTLNQSLTARLQPVHNIFLLTFAEMGLVGLVILFAFLCSLFSKTNSSALVLFFIFALITAFFDHYWLTLQQPLLLVGLIIGLRETI